MTTVSSPGDYLWLKTYPEGIDWHADIQPRAVHSLMDDTAAKHGDRPGFDFMGKKLLWREIADMASRFAKGLQNAGLKKGDRVALFLPNCPYYVASYYGVLKAGGIVVNLNPLYPQNELEHMVVDSGVDMLVTADLSMLWDKAKSLPDTTPLKKIIVCDFTDSLPFPKNMLFSLARRHDLAHIEWSDKIIRFADITANDGKPSAVTIDPLNDIAVLQYTGGTTGAPKGAMLTHANITANVQQAGLWFCDARPGQDKMLGVIPFFHVFAMTAVMNLSVLYGLEIIATPRFDLNDTLKIIQRKKPNIFPAVPAIFSAINHSPKLKNYDLSSLRYCVSGGAPLPVEVKKTFEAQTGSVVVEGYGLTESSPVACVNPTKGTNKPGSIGLPLPGTIIEIRDPDTRELVKQGERGELCIRGPQVMKGYWKKPEDTAQVLVDGLLHTGDIATMDKEGYTFIVDRIKDMIITNGYKVYPRNVEEAIYRHPAVEECIVAGLPDMARGEIVKAWVKPKEGQSVTADEIKSFLKDKLSPMELPRQVDIRDKPLPKTMIGKLSRKDIVAEEMKTGAAAD
jgi:long-chain acyl-CoA synthetase